MSLCSMLAASAYSSAAFAGGFAACNSATHSCDVTGGVGCTDVDCCNTVCGADGFCCSVAWDGICVDEAASLCAGPSCPGECDGDLAAPFGVVDGADLAVLLGDWGTSGTCSNIDGLGTVDGADLAILLGSWGDCPEPPSACESADHDCCSTGGPGCTDVECCETVCAADPFCCSVAWDTICRGEAISICGLDCSVECPPSDHDCFTSGTAGCTDTECCSAVCLVDPFCCSVAWDGICVGEAFSNCELPVCEFSCTGTDEGEPCGDDTNGGCNTPPAGNSSCCIPNGGIGCDDAACQDIVCTADPFCCSVAWDGICAGEAASLCGDLCASTPNFGSIECGETICGTAWADGNIRDTDWYEVTFEAPTQITISMRSQLSMVFGVVNTNDCNTATAINPFAISPFCGAEATTIDFCIPAGTWWIFAAPNSFAGFPCGSNNGYELSLACGGECVALACGTAGHDCFTTGGPFCDDVECCETVCALDPFCCTTAWDGICVGEAGSFCVTCDIVCSGTGEGEPCGDDTNGGCNSSPAVFGSIDCGETICGNFWATGGTRDTDWFEFTLESASEVSVTGEAEFGFVVGVVSTGGVPDCGLATQLNPFAVGAACTTATATGCLSAGTWWAFIAPSVFDGLACDAGKNDYSLSLTCGGDCSPAGCGNAGHDCFTTGGPFCDDADCCNTVCAADPFCCSVAWDGICVGEAGSLCN